jgi:integrase
LSIADALASYGAEHAPHAADPVRIGYAITALLTFWGDLPISAVTRANCRLYGEQRHRRTADDRTAAPIAAGTIRRELGTLRAALNHCVKEGYLARAPYVFLPEKPAPRDRWLTRSEAARLLDAAWRNPNTKHLARLILIGLYTGSRKQTILQLSFMPSTTAGWIDTEAGLLYRRGSEATETAKRRPTARLPRQLRAHARRWERNGHRWAVEYRGARVADLKNAWRAACAAAGLEGVTPHTLRHTAITWAMQRGAAPADVAGFFGVSLEVLERVYWHYHPDFQGSAVAAMEGGVSVQPHSNPAQMNTNRGNERRKKGE